MEADTTCEPSVALSLRRLFRSDPAAPLPTRVPLRMRISNSDVIFKIFRGRALMHGSNGAKIGDNDRGRGSVKIHYFYP